MAKRKKQSFELTKEKIGVATGVVLLLGALVALFQSLHKAPDKPVETPKPAVSASSPAPGLAPGPAPTPASPPVNQRNDGDGSVNISGGSNNKVEIKR